MKLFFPRVEVEGNDSSFENEKDIASKFTGKFFARVHETECDKLSGRHYILMDFIDGSTLKDFLKRGYFPAKKAVNIAINLSRAVSVMHKQNVLHCFLNPSGILLSEKYKPENSEPRAKAFDFDFGVPDN